MEQQGCSELTSAQRPRVSLSPQRAESYDSELIRVLTKAINELGLDWSAPEEPTRSHLDEWFLQPGRWQQAPH